jgi:hypothetical protein
VKWAVMLLLWLEGRSKRLPTYFYLPKCDHRGFVCKDALSPVPRIRLNDEAMRQVRCAIWRYWVAHQSTGFDE